MAWPTKIEYQDPVPLNYSVEVPSESEEEGGEGEKPPTEYQLFPRGKG